MSTSTTYSPVPSLVPFFLSDAFVSLVCGPVGSTKTTSGIVKILYHAKRMAPCRDGIRRSRCVWVRNTREQLRDTSIPDFLKWFPDGLAGAFAKTDSKFILRLDDVECEVLFRGLDDANDVRRLLSLQASFAVLDEFREINKDIYEALQGRLGRYPDGSMVPHRPEWGVDSKGNPIQGCVTDDGKPNSHLWGMSNPPDMDTFWEGVLSAPPDNAHVTIQPSGMSALADWIHLLPTNYYENLAKGKSEEYIDIYIHAKFGKSLAGQPVFKSFDADFHVSKHSLNPILNGLRPLLIGMDFGLNPSAVIGQMDAMGRLVIYRALTSSGMGLLRFLRTHLKPELASSFPGAPVLVIGDPAGTARVQTDERTVYDVLKQEGFRAVPARTNSIIARVSAVDKFLNAQVDAGAGMLLDPACGVLIRAMRGGYRYKLKTNGEYDDLPEKNEHSHICFAAGTMIDTPLGERAIETLVAGDMVSTPLGPRPLLRAWQSSPAAAVSTYMLEDGREIVATPEHPVATARGWVPIDEVEYLDVLFGVSNTEGATWLQNTRSSTSMDARTTAGARATTPLRFFPSAKPGTCTATCGSTTTGQFPTATKSTTRTATAHTTPSAISNSSLVPSTPASTCSSESQPTQPEIAGRSTQPEKPPKRGTLPTPGGNGTASTPRAWLPRKSLWTSFARGVAKRTSATCATAPSFSALRLVRAWLARSLVWTTKPAPVPPAAASSAPIGTGEQKPAPRIVGKQRCLLPSAVYALTVDDVHVFYANGVLVSNCDAVQYLCMHADATGGGSYDQHAAVEVQVVSLGGWT
jgi:hypothetical protein